MNSRVLVAGIGNIFLGDDAFGVEVVQRLAEEKIPPEVQVANFGMRSMDLAYALMEPWETVLMVEAISRGGRPGTLYLLSPTLPPSAAAIPQFDGHTMDPFKVMQLAAALGAPRHCMRLLGCEPAVIPSESPAEAYLEKHDHLSEPVRRAVPQAVSRIKSLVNEFLATPAIAL